MHRLFLLILCICLPLTTHAKTKVVNSPHNLSASGQGTFKSMTTKRICVFCHAPHSVVPDAPLWNRNDTGQTYTQYSSSTMMSVPGQPAGSSRLCLACHDGTVALERMAVMPRGASKNISSKHLAGRGNLGTDLGDDHPISFVYDAELSTKNGELVHPDGVPLPMDNGMVRCGTCHEPHDSSIKPFLRMPSSNGDLCTACHAQFGSNWDWTRSSHATSAARPKGAKPWRERKPQWKGSTVAENACFNCHTPHNAATPARLIVDREEATCFRCHDGSVAKTDIQTDVFKPSPHPVTVTPNSHHDADKAEDPLRMRLHVECGDCHNPHATKADAPMITVDPNLLGGGFERTLPPLANGLINGVSGIANSGIVKEEIENQYEICFKCHGVPGKSACDNSRCTTARSMGHTRVDNTYNIREKVNPTSNPRLISYHPIVENNPYNSVPSLRRELGLNSIDTLIYCTDCHNSDQSSAGSGTGAEGPHGSIYSPILANRYTLSTKYASPGLASRESALCFKCHDEGVLRSDFDNNGFKHGSHLQSGTCITCHDPHGSMVGKHLINFGTRNNLVSPGDSPVITGAGAYSQPTWIETPQGGECWLRCHSGPEHLGFKYPPDPMSPEDPTLPIDPTIPPGNTTPSDF